MLLMLPEIASSLIFTAKRRIQAHYATYG